MAALIREVIAHERAMDLRRQQFAFRQLRTVLRGNESHPKSDQALYEDFYIDGIEVHRLLSINHLSTFSKEAQNQHLLKRLSLLKQQTTPDYEIHLLWARDYPVPTIAHALETGQCSNLTEGVSNHRPVYLVDYTPDPTGPSNGVPERILRASTFHLTIDQQDKIVTRYEGLVHSSVRTLLFAFLPGLTVDVSFHRTSDGVWLPAEYHLSVPRDKPNIAREDSIFSEYHLVPPGNESLLDGEWPATSDDESPEIDPTAPESSPALGSSPGPDPTPGSTTPEPKPHP